MIKKEAMKLVKALRSGKYEQGYGYLHYKNGNIEKFCCLGVACELVEGLHKVSKNYSDASDIVKIKVIKAFTYDGEVSFLPKKVKDKFGFFNEVGQRKDKLPLNFPLTNNHFSSLASANDSALVNFAMIADYIEENWEAL